MTARPLFPMLPPAGLATSNAGFTLIELILIIVLLGTLSVTAVIKWPSGMDDRAAALEFKRALRHAQHLAMTREYVDATPWGLFVDANRYTIKSTATETASEEFVDRALLGKTETTIAVTPAITLYFNGLGEPIASNGTPLTSAVTYTIDSSQQLTVCPQTGYVLEGSSCP